MIPCPILIGDEWREGNGAATSPVYNPSRGEVIAEVPMCGADIVNEAVESAAAAFPAWRETPPAERARVFFRHRRLVGGNFHRLFQNANRERRKALGQARRSGD